MAELVMVDANQDATPELIDELDRQVGGFDIWAGYLGTGGGAAKPLSADGVAHLLARKKRVVPIINDVLPYLLEHAPVTCAERAIAKAEALKVQARSIIVLDYEQQKDWPIDGQFCQKVCDYIQARGYTPVVYSTARRLEALGHRGLVWVADWLTNGRYTRKDVEAIAKLPAVHGCFTWAWQLADETICDVSAVAEQLFPYWS